MMYLLLFVLVAGIMIYFAKRLTVSGEELGDGLGMEASWVGALLLASITSLPELIIGGGSSLMGNQSMAVSNIFGSNIFNLFIVFLMDIFILRNFIFMGEIDEEEGINLSKLTLILTAIFMGGFLLKDVNLLGQSPFILLILGIYLKFLKGEGGSGEKKRVSYHDIKKPLKAFILDSIGVVGLGIALSKIADIIAVTPIMGHVLGQSIVGALLLAVATSLPELTVSIESVRRGNCQQAMGNILGSNLFNLGTLFVLEILSKGSLYTHLGELNMGIPVVAFIMQGVFMGGLYLQKRRSSLVMGVIYMASLYFVL